MNNGYKQDKGRVHQKKKEANSKILKFFYFKFYSSISIICRNSLVISQIKLTKPTATSDLRTKQSVFAHNKWNIAYTWTWQGLSLGLFALFFNYFLPLQSIPTSLFPLSPWICSSSATARNALRLSWLTLTSPRYIKSSTAFTIKKHW